MVWITQHVSERTVQAGLSARNELSFDAQDYSAFVMGMGELRTGHGSLGSSMVDFVGKKGRADKR